MAEYVRKTYDVWILEENWGYGWEYVGEYGNKHDGMVDLRKYQEDIRIRIEKGHEIYSVRLRKERRKKETGNGGV